MHIPPLRFICACILLSLAAACADDPAAPPETAGTEQCELAEGQNPNEDDYCSTYADMIAASDWWAEHLLEDSTLHDGRSED